MRKYLKKVARSFAMEWSWSMQYRVDIFLWMLSEAAIPLVSLAIWYTISQTSKVGLTPTETLTYYILVIFIKTATDAWGGYWISQEILTGQIIKYLIRPFSYFWKKITNNITEKVIKLIIPVPIFIAMFLAFPEKFSSSIYEVKNLILFAVSLALAIVLSFTLDTIFGLLAFWLEDAAELRNYKGIFEIVASGILIPFALLPPLARTMFSLLPFRYIVSAPAEILLGQTSASQTVILIGSQIAWITLCFAANKLLWVRGLKRYAVPGQ